MDIKKGSIIDVYPEGGPTFRACVLSVDGKFFKVINLETGEVADKIHYECEDPIIDNIFNI